MTHTPTPWEAVCWVGKWEGISRGESFMFDGRECPQHAFGPCRNYGEDTGWTRIGREEGTTKRAVACVNFFHGRDIATENIPEGGFWEMVDMIHRLTIELNTARVTHIDEDAREFFKGRVNEGLDLLTKLGVEP